MHTKVRFTCSETFVHLNEKSKKHYMKPTEIRELAMAFQKSRIILTAFELDVFTLLDKKNMDTETVAEGLNLNKGATERFLNALVGLNLLVKKEGNFSNNSHSMRYLSKNSPDYLAGLGHTNHLWDTWSGLTDVVKTGKAAHDTKVNERENEWLVAFIHAMHDRGMKQAPAQLAHIDLKGVNSVLDVGGGSGCFCMKFLNRKPNLKTVVFDLPNVLPISKKIVEEEGFSGRIDFYEGDFTTDELPKGFDLVFLSAIIHSNSFETNRELVKKCFNALNPDGKIIIQDWIMNDTKTEPVQGAVFSINMLVETEEGDCYSESEINSWFRDAGFTDSKKVELETGLGQVMAIKRIV